MKEDKDSKSVNTIQFAGCKNPIPMEKFLKFLTVKTKLSRKNLGGSNGWRERYNEAEKLVIIGCVMRGVEYLHAIEFGDNPFYLLMTSEGKAFFKEHYSDEIKKLIQNRENNMRNTYTVYAMDEEPETRVLGEFGHDIVGVFDSFDAAKAIAEQLKQYENVIIMENCLFGLTGASWQSVSHKHRSKEVWRWCAANDEFCS